MVHAENAKSGPIISENALKMANDNRSPLVSRWSNYNEMVNSGKHKIRKGWCFVEAEYIPVKTSLIACCLKGYIWLQYPYDQKCGRSIALRPACMESHDYLFGTA